MNIVKGGSFERICNWYRINLNGQMIHTCHHRIDAISVVAVVVIVATAAVLAAQLYNTLHFWFTYTHFFHLILTFTCAMPSLWTETIYDFISFFFAPLPTVYIYWEGLIHIRKANWIFQQICAHTRRRLRQRFWYVV